MQKSFRAVFTVRLSLVLLIMLALAASALAQTSESVLLNFPGGGSGSNPYAGLIADSSGSLYGTTGEGGNSTQCDLGSGCGTVFMLSASPVWTETVLYSFGGFTGDGAGPQASLVFDTKGNLYGTTSSGGAYGYGTVFELSPPATAGDAWTEAVLYSFQGGTDGSYPSAGLVFDGTSICGTTPFGGTYDFGTAFELTPPATAKGVWTEKLLYNFEGLADGGKPYSGLVLKGKNLYGTTLDGGPSGQGAVYELVAPAAAGDAWTEDVLYGFTGGTDGGKPYASVIFGVASGTTTDLFGSTGLGGSTGYGTVFQLTPNTVAPWNETVLYSFTGETDGSYPRYGVVSDTSGNLYGTTGVGVGNSGVVFEIARTVNGTVATWTDSVLWSFTGGSDGGDPAAGLLLSGGVLYGTTSLGGEYSDGTVFSTPVGSTGAPAVTLSVASLSFGSVAVNTTSAVKTVTVTNSGTATLDISSIAPSSDFAVSSTTCGATVAVGKNCKVSLTFTPTEVGAVTGTLTFNDNASNTPQTVALSGTGIAPATLTPASATFASETVGSTTAAKTFTLTNNQTVALTSIASSTTGDFAVSATTCTTSLAAKGKCTISVTFTPTAPGTLTGTLQVTDSASTSPQTSSLTGTGAVAATLTPATETYAAQTVGTTSAAKTLTLTNKQAVALTSIAISTSGDFAVSATTCTSSLAAKGTCTISVTFTPPTTGTLTGALEVADSAGSQTSSLTGTGKAAAAK